MAEPNKYVSKKEIAEIVDTYLAGLDKAMKDAMVSIAGDYQFRARWKQDGLTIADCKKMGRNPDGKYSDGENGMYNIQQDINEVLHYIMMSIDATEMKKNPDFK